MDEDMEGGMAVDEYTQPLHGHRRLEQHWDAGRSPFELLRESKSSVEDVVARILAVKRDGLPKFELRELVTQIFLHFVTLRQVRWIGCSPSFSFGFLDWPCIVDAPSVLYLGGHGCWTSSIMDVCRMLLYFEESWSFYRGARSL